ncbi:MAG: NAD(P)-binding domain-containing protein [Candidatus Dormibacteraeota bacterium]|nr:NAD(P)-binding domain-containing protein [Candidatus Dormibacteraeota bacterium]
MRRRMIAANINQPRPRVALLGAGTMGSGMAQRLLELGFSVDVWNRARAGRPAC